MNLQAIDITLGRMRHIESRISSIDKKFEQMLEGHSRGVKSFNDVLDRKLNALDEIEKTEKKQTEKTGENEFQKLIEKYSKKNGLDEDLVNAVIQTESAFNNKAVSPVGAKGLMQLMPSTAQEMGVNDPFDPEQNISGGTKYLKKLINKYNSVELGLAAYNAGPENVNKYQGVPPYNETQNYVKKIMKLQGN